MDVSLPPGTMVSRYRVLKRIGAGGMGEVYLAHDDTLDRLVALKILHADVASDEQRMRRFTQEAKTTSALNHPNILTVYEIGGSGATRFIATEFIAGVTLRERLRQTRMDLRELLDIAIQVARALETAHDAGVVHRDIKPENIMLRPDGYVKVLDFGIAKLAERISDDTADTAPESHSEAADTETRKITPVALGKGEAHTIFMGNTGTNEVLGTVEYLSPEQARGLPVDARTDIFSFGIVLYEMIAGRKPFRGHSGWEVMTAILEQQPEPLRLYLPKIPKPLQQLIDRALAKERVDRFQTIKELGEALQRLREEIDFKARLQTSKSDSTGDDNSSGKQSGAEPARSHRSSKALTGNLPLQPTPLIGRNEEVDRVVALLRAKNVRLVTLTGPGGTGKTRLAIESAAEMRTYFDGIFFVALAPISSPGLLASAISEALGIKETKATPPDETIKDFLSEKKILLLLDNFEQITSAAPLVAELLASCSQLKILVTSRAVLNLRSEHEFPVPPLALPDPEHLPSTTALSQYSAVALFVDRAAAGKRNFALNRDNAQAVVEICARLDGLPLAIELAAARIKLLTPEEILQRMERRLKLLTGGAADLPARQQTMRSAIGWSFDLLSASEKKLFAELSVFVNGCSLDAIEAVCSRPDETQSELLDQLSSLVDKSLLRQQERRFSMLETIREYALEELEAAGAEATLRERHARWFMNLIEQAEPEFTEASQVAWFERIATEHDNLRAALQWASDSGEAELGLRIAGAMWRFWEVRGHLSEGRKWLEGLLSQSGATAPIVLAKALSRAGALERDQGDYTQAALFLKEALRLYRQLDDKWGIAATLNGIGYVVHEQGDFARATDYYEESLALFRELGDKRAAAYLLNNLGNVAKEQADYGGAAKIHEEALALLRELGDKRALSFSLNNMGEIAQHIGEYGRAELFHRESLELKRELRDTRGIAASLNNLGDLARYRGKYTAAAVLYQESLALHRDNGDKRNIAHCLEALAEAACARQDPAQASLLLGAAEALRETIGAPLPLADRADYDRTIAEARTALGEQEFAARWQRGKTLTVNQAIEYALE